MSAWPYSSYYRDEPEDDTEDQELEDEILENEIEWLGVTDEILRETVRFAHKLGRDLTRREQRYIAIEASRQYERGQQIDVEAAYHEGHAMDHREPADRDELMMERLQDMEDMRREAEIPEVYDVSTDEGRHQWMVDRVEGRIGPDHPVTGEAGQEEAA